MAIYLLTPIKNAMSALELERHMGVSHNTAWLLKSKVLHVMKEREDCGPSLLLDGGVGAGHRTTVRALFTPHWG